MRDQPASIRPRRPEDMSSMIHHIASGTACTHLLYQILYAALNRSEYTSPFTGNVQWHTAYVYPILASRCGPKDLGSVCECPHSIPSSVKFKSSLCVFTWSDLSHSVTRCSKVASILVVNRILRWLRKRARWHTETDHGPARADHFLAPKSLWRSPVSHLLNTTTGRRICSAGTTLEICGQRLPTRRLPQLFLTQLLHSA